MPDAGCSTDLDSAYAKDLGGFILRAAGRHRVLSSLIFLLGVAASMGAVVLAPRVYQAETKILAQQNLVMPVLVNPNRAVSSQADAPTRAAREMILTRASLLAIIKETNLADEWNARRSPLLRFKDRVTSALLGPMSEEDKLRALIELLESRLSVTAENMTIGISVEWDSPEISYSIVRSAQEGFLSRRSERELAVISDTLAILEEQSKKQGALLGSTLTEVQKLWKENAALAPPQLPTLSGPTPLRVRSPRSVPRPSTAPIEALLAETRSAIKTLDEPRLRWLGVLNAKLQELQTTFGPAHPAIIAHQAQVREAGVESPEVTRLRREEQDILERIKSASTGASEVASGKDFGAPAPALSGAPLVSSPGEPLKTEQSPELEIARAKLLSAARKYQDLVDRIDSAQIELYTAKAAFKYRYDVVLPPELPRKPIKPNVPMLAVGGLLLSAVLSVFAAAARDITGGRFIEAWQVRRRLKIPMLAEVRRP